MRIPSPHRFWHPGPAEYILVMAGLFDVVDFAVSWRGGFAILLSCAEEGANHFATAEAADMLGWRLQRRGRSRYEPWTKP